MWCWGKNAKNFLRLMWYYNSEGQVSVGGQTITNWRHHFENYWKSWKGWRLHLNCFLLKCENTTIMIRWREELDQAVGFNFLGSMIVKDGGSSVDSADDWLRQRKLLQHLKSCGQIERCKCALWITSSQAPELVGSFSTLLPPFCLNRCQGNCLYSVFYKTHQNGNPYPQCALT